MNRCMAIGMFTAMKALADVKEYEKLSFVIEETLAAAKGEKADKTAKNTDKDEN